MKILIVESSQAVADRLVASISVLPDIAIVGTLPHTRGLIQSIRELRPEVIIMDAHVSGGKGIEALKRIKQESPATIVIVLTNSAISQYRTKCREAGADYFLDKSTEFQHIFHLLRALAQRSPSETTATEHIERFKSGIQVTLWWSLLTLKAIGLATRGWPDI
jgi:DNA-binding NarL/FixJ family response regulator